MNNGKKSKNFFQNQKPDLENLDGLAVVEILEAASNSLKNGGGKVQIGKPLPDRLKEVLSRKKQVPIKTIDPDKKFADKALK